MSVHLPETWRKPLDSGFAKTASKPLCIPTGTWGLSTPGMPCSQPESRSVAAETLLNLCQRNPGSLESNEGADLPRMQSNSSSELQLIALSKSAPGWTHNNGGEHGIQRRFQSIWTFSPPHRKHPTAASDRDLQRLLIRWSCTRPCGQLLLLLFCLAFMS